MVIEAVLRNFHKVFVRNQTPLFSWRTISSASDGKRRQYPHKFPVNHSLADFKTRFDSVQSDTKLKNDVSVAGRVASVRVMGKSLAFLTIQSGGKTLHSLQIKAVRSEYVSETEFREDINLISRGDLIGASGTLVTKTAKSGELSLIPKKINLLSPCLKTIPSSITGLDNVNKRYRHRHIDFLVHGDEKRWIFEVRSRVVGIIRQYLDVRDFLEVETPILSHGFGGASAKPFQTRHIELNRDMFLRIAPELYLKTLVIGGFDRVYEIGKQFRNEGIDPNHSPEFTSVEFYAAYLDYFDLMEWTQDLLKAIVVDIHGSTTCSYQNRDLEFGHNFGRLDFIESLEAATGKQFPEEFESRESSEFLSDVLIANGVKVSSRSNGKILDKLFSLLVEPELFEPTFVLDHPLCMSPLAKPHRNKKGRTERFELYVGQQEIINAYTELNDPDLQRRMFQTQTNREGDEHDLNEEFCNALEFGLPPTAGWGMGLDRLIMLLTNQTSIKEVLFFPTLKSN